MALLCQSNTCASEEYRLSIRTARLETEYEKTLCRRRALIDEEQHRLLRVNLVFLENENEELNGQLQRATGRLESLEATESHMQTQLLEAQNHNAGSQNSLRTKIREINNLKSEIASLNSNSLESTKILTEKLRLSRELSTLKAELEHLRSQSESYQTLLTGKLSLERQLSSLEVELDTTKRALERARAKDVKQKEEDDTDAQLEELSIALAREKKERERIEKQAGKQTIEWENERSALGSKLDAFQHELRSTKSQLRDIRSEAQGQSTTRPEARISGESEKERRISRNRSIPRFDPEMTIGTPGDVHHHKKTKLSSALPGDKSMFSITPFLNRTSISFESQLEQSSSSGSDEEANINKAESALGVGKDGSVHPRAPRPSLTKSRKSAANDPQESRAPNPNSRQIRIRGSSSTSALEKVAEEDDDENENQPPQAEHPKGESKPKLKRQKFLGAAREKTLFDEDEPPEGIQMPRRIALGAGRGLNMRGGKQLAATNPLRGEVLEKADGRPEFSPLKRSKKPM